MTDMQDRSYYLGRAEQEKEAGNRASNPAIAAVHFELAYRYSLLAEGIPTLVPQLRTARG